MVAIKKWMIENKNNFGKHLEPPPWRSPTDPVFLIFQTGQLGFQSYYR